MTKMDVWWKSKVGRIKEYRAGDGGGMVSE